MEMNQNWTDTLTLGQQLMILFMSIKLLIRFTGGFFYKMLENCKKAHYML